MNFRKFRIFVAFSALACAAPVVHADEWCDLEPGWNVVTHGTAADNVFILGSLVGRPGALWLIIATPTVGKTNIALALTAQTAGKRLSIYVTSPMTCANFPSWASAGSIYHIRMLD